MSSNANYLPYFTFGTDTKLHQKKNKKIGKLWYQVPGTHFENKNKNHFMYQIPRLPVG